MPNAKGGKKFKRGKKNSSIEKKLIYKNPKEEQEYAKVISACGNGRFTIQCFDGRDRLGIIAGNMRKRVWVNKDDIVLISRWGFSTDDNKCSIIHKYDSDEVKKLQKNNEFPETIRLDPDSEFNNNDEDMITFEYDDLSDLSDLEEEEEKPEEEKKSEEEINLDEI